MFVCIHESPELSIDNNMDVFCLQIVSFLNNLLHNQTKHDKYFYGTYGITRQTSSLPS